ncbi:MAG TPA: TIM barrel protein [Thermoplasmata archaeon]|nr:TIM barrel protein [Thermoplasmata archaeon]
MKEIRFGPAGIPIGCKGGTLEGIKCAKEEGLSALEVEFVRGVRMREETATRVNKLAKVLDVVLSCHAPYWINCSAKEPEKLEIAKRNLLAAVRMAHLMGAWIVVFHPGYYMGREPREASELVVTTLKEVLAQMRKEKISDVTLGMETTGKVSAVGTLAETIEMSKKLDQTQPVIDFAHLHARGGGSLKQREDYGKVFDELEEGYGKDILKKMHCHFSEIEFTDKGERKHLPLGERYSPPFEPLAMELVERKIKGTVISESPLLDKDALKMKEMVEKVKLLLG